MDVVGVGALNLDHLVRGSSESLPVERGSEGWVAADVVLPFTGTPPTLGGSAFNTVSTLSATGLELRLGFVGVVGSETAHVSRLDALGVDRRFVFRSDGPTGTCVAVLEDDDRTLLIHPGANDAMPRFLDAALVEYLAAARIVHLTSFLDRSTPAELATLMRAVRARGTSLSLDPGHEWATAPSPAVLELIGMADYLFLNEREFEALGPGPGVTVVKSASGVRVLERGTDTFTGHVPLATGDVVDPVGAGDVFAAGYLAALVSPRIPTGAGPELGLALARHALRHDGLPLADFSALVRNCHPGARTIPPTDDRQSP